MLDWWSKHLFIPRCSRWISSKFRASHILDEIAMALHLMGSAPLCRTLNCAHVEPGNLQIHWWQQYVTEKCLVISFSFKTASFSNIFSKGMLLLPVTSPSKLNQRIGWLVLRCPPFPEKGTPRPFWHVLSPLSSKCQPLTHRVPTKATVACPFFFFFLSCQSLTFSSPGYWQAPI